MKLNLLIVFFFFISNSCSKSIDDNVFEGEWFAIGATNWDHTQWIIDKDLTVIPTLSRTDSEYSFQLTKDENDIYTLTDEYGSGELLGSIISLKTDTIKFSNGLSLIKLNKPTRTNYNIAEFEELLKNSILEYSLDGMNTRLYLSDTLSSLGFNQLSVIQTGALSTAGLYENWKVSSFNNTYTILYTINSSSEVYSTLINSISDSIFTGYLYYFYDPIPISFTIKPSISNAIKDSISEKLINTHWLTTSTSVFDFAENYPDVIIEEEELIMEALDVDLGMTIKEKDIDNNPFTFEFKKSGVFQVYKFGIPSYEMKWKVANDGDFVFIYDRYYGQSYVSLKNLNQPLRMLDFELGINLDIGDNLITSEMLSFELTSK